MVELWKLAMCLTTACGQLVTLGMDATEVQEECVQAARDWALIRPEKRFICKGMIAGSRSLWMRQVIIGPGHDLAIRHSRTPYRRYLASRIETEQGPASSPASTPSEPSASETSNATSGQSEEKLEEVRKPKPEVAMLPSTVPGMVIVPLEQPNASNITRAGFDQIDNDFQPVTLWQLLKHEFPEWYGERLIEVTRLRSEGVDRAIITRQLASAIVALRRRNASNALAASPKALKRIAETFLGSLQNFSHEGVQACYGFISQGETSPQIIRLMNWPGHAKVLQRQITAVFAAIIEGRRSPQAHTSPRTSDYLELTQQLLTRGWTNREIQIFSSPSAMTKAPPEIVCKLVQDWFAAHLSVTDEDVQLRLLYESLKPIVAG